MLRVSVIFTFLYNDQLSSYDVLLSKSGRCTMRVFRLKFMCIEIFKTLNKLNPSFMQDIFKVKSSSYSLRGTNSLQHYRPNQVTFGSNSLRSLGPQVWNGLSNDMKSAENLNMFKNMLKKWEGPNCKCSVCKCTVYIEISIFSFRLQIKFKNIFFLYL